MTNRLPDTSPESDAPSQNVPTYQEAAHRLLTAAFKSSGDTEAAAFHLQRAKLYSDVGSLGAAYGAYDSAISAAENSRDNMVLLDILYHKAEFLASAGAYEAARYVFMQAAAALEGTNHSSPQARGAIIGHLALKTKAVDKLLATLPKSGRKNGALAQPGTELTRLNHLRQLRGLEPVAWKPQTPNA